MCQIQVDTHLKTQTRIPARDFDIDCSVRNGLSLFNFFIFKKVLANGPFELRTAKTSGTVVARIPNTFGIRMVGVVRFSNCVRFSNGVQNFIMAIA